MADKIPISTVFAVAGNILAQNECLKSNSEMMAGPERRSYRQRRCDEIAVVALALARSVEYLYGKQYGDITSYTDATNGDKRELNRT